MGSDRYARQRAIEGFDQARVAALRVGVVGAGAIGNEVVKNLALLGVGRIQVFDFDTVELHNLTRSILLREADVGQSKARCVAARAARIDPAVTLEALHGDIAETLGPSVLRGLDVVIGAVDNFEARIRINQMCLLLGRPWVNAAIDSRHASVEVFPFAGDAAAPACACYECALPESVYQRLAERRSCGGLRRAVARERLVPTTAVTASVAGALAVGEALRVAGCDRRVVGTAAVLAERVFVDVLAGHAGRTALAHHDLCAGCGLTPRAVLWAGRAASAQAAAVLLLGARSAAGAETATGAQATGSEATGAQAAGAQAAGAQAAGRVGSDDPAVQLSDALILRCECRRCGRLAALVAYEGRRAATVSDAAARCPQCSGNSVDIDIRDTLGLDDLCQRFGDRQLPAVWLRCGERFVELAA